MRISLFLDLEAGSPIVHGTLGTAMGSFTVPLRRLILFLPDDGTRAKVVSELRAELELTRTRERQLRAAAPLAGDEKVAEADELAGLVAAVEQELPVA